MTAIFGVLQPKQYRALTAVLGVQGNTQMSAVVQWLRMTAACPTPHPTSPIAASWRARRRKRKQQQQAQQQLPAQHAQQAVQIPGPEQPHLVSHSPSEITPAVPSTTPDVPSSAGQPVGVATCGSVREGAAQAEGQQTTAPTAAAALPADAAAATNAASIATAAAATTQVAAPLVAPLSSWGGSPQQEWGYMVALAQLRSVMFEDVAVLALEELPAAGKHCP